VRLQAFGNALQLLLILRVRLRPQHLTRGGAEKFPIPVGPVGVVQSDRGKSVGYLRSQEVTVLEADLPGAAFEMNVNPATLVKAVGAAQARVGQRS